MKTLGISGAEVIEIERSRAEANMRGKCGGVYRKSEGKGRG